jgi:CARDB
MRRGLAIAGLLVATLATTQAFASGDSTSTAWVKVVECTPDAHEAAFYARMRQVPGGDRMLIRFTLLARTGAHGFDRVDAPGLERWHRSKSGVAAFGYRQGVRNLSENVVYRVRVDYRWLSPEGDTLLTASHRSAPCRQFDALPNLHARLLDAAATSVPGTLRYDIRTWNSGLAPANAVEVSLEVDGRLIETMTVASLFPDESSQLPFRGPECQSVVRTKADPDGAIVETSEDDNVHQLACSDVPRQ